ncbi:hypothetical protein RU639_007605 [Aspergillus parasiticus]
MPTNSRDAYQSHYLSEAELKEEKSLPSHSNICTLQTREEFFVVNRHTITISSVVAAPAKDTFMPGSIPQGPEDPLYSLVASYEADKPWILPAIQKAKKIYHSDPDLRF